jgi:hypothetical protein
MKKINLSNIKDSLTKNELNKIMAGSGDISNGNVIQGCCCLFSNSSVLTNVNQIVDCRCDC